MAKAKTTVTLDEGLLSEIDSLVQNDVFESRSQALEQAVRSLLAARAEAAFLAALDALDPSEEREWSEWGMSDYAEVVDRDA